VFHVVPALAQFIKGGETSVAQSSSKDRRLDATRMPIQQPHAIAAFKISDRLRDRGLGYTQLHRSFRHATCLHDREEHMQVA
jgi:hypothetical protein